MSEPTPTGEIILYQTEDGLTRVDCRFADDSIWLTQRLMAELFQTSIPNINQHLSSIFEDGELSPERTIKKFLIVQTEGSRQVSLLVDHYNLDTILAVGYRVRSQRGTAFRQWATARLSEYLVKGFTIDDARLKNPPGPGVPDLTISLNLMNAPSFRRPAEFRVKMPIGRRLSSMIFFTSAGLPKLKPRPRMMRLRIWKNLQKNCPGKNEILNDRL